MDNDTAYHSIEFDFVLHQHILEEQLTVILMDLFLAGAETTSTTLTWSLINLITHPEKQKKIHEEIDRVLGDNQPSLEYKGR